MFPLTLCGAKIKQQQHFSWSATYLDQPDRKTGMGLSVEICHHFCISLFKDEVCILKFYLSLYWKAALTVNILSSKRSRYYFELSNQFTTIWLKLWHEFMVTQSIWPMAPKGEFWKSTVKLKKKKHCEELYSWANKTIITTITIIIIIIVIKCYYCCL